MSERGIWPNTKEGGEIPHSQFCLLTPLLISQTTKEVWYQELWAPHHTTTVEWVNYIMNVQYAICKGRVLLDGLGLNQCLLIGNPLPQSRIICLICFQDGFGDFYFLWIRVVKTIVATANLVWDAEARKWNYGVKQCCCCHQLCPKVLGAFWEDNHHEKRQ